MSQTNECLKRLTAFADQESLFAAGDKLLLAVSAGADSTAMLYLMSRLRFSYNLSLLAVHINHQLRGEASMEDERHIKEICMRLSVPLVIRRIELGQEGDLENRARIARFETFRIILENYKFNRIMLAHHKWDHAETFLMNLFRGAGLSGMSGIKALNGDVAHPMLAFNPQELRELLLEAGISWREDASNADNRFTRNRMRNELMPLLVRDYNPQIREKLCDSAVIFNQADQYIAERARRKFRKICVENGSGRIVLSIPDLLKSVAIERFYILREAFNQACGTRLDLSGNHVRELSELLTSAGSKFISLPHGVLAIKRYQELHFSIYPEDVHSPEAETLTIGNERARAVHMDHRFSFKLLKVLPAKMNEMDKTTVILDADKLCGHIKIRRRIAGDRFIPFGMREFKKLKDFFIDEKVAKYDRDLIPVFEDDEKIIWICGWRLDNRVRYDENTTRYLMIHAESLQNKANRAASRKKRGTNELDEL